MTKLDTQDAFLISTDALAAHLDDANVLIFDTTAGPVPTPEGERDAHDAFLHSHIPNARWLDQNLLSDPDAAYRYTAPAPEALARTLETLGITREHTVVLYATTSVGWAARVWWLLRSIGFDQARLLDGGWQRWRAEGRATASGAATALPPAAPGSLPVTPRQVFVGQARVLQAVTQHDAHLVDALPAAHYRGEQPSKHGRRGHIAGAHNVPNTQLLHATDHTFLDVAASAALFAAQGIDASKPVITYCGAGIAASVDAFAALRAGYPDVQIYDASLAEWARNPALPMVPGTP